MNKNILLVIALVLLGIGILRPDVSSFVKPKTNTDTVVFVQPKEDYNVYIAKIIKSLSVDPDRKIDGKRLANLAADVSTLISLDGENETIKNTEEIRQINKLVGPMLKLDIKGKYPDLANVSQELIVSAIGDDAILLDKELRIKASEAFMALAWAYNEGAK
jgi:hypothetical protein